MWFIQSPNDHWILKCNAFWIVGLEPGVRCILIGEQLQVIGIAGFLSGIDVDPDGAHELGPTILFTLRLFGI